ncbi:GNAT family N-acetyltransferase [Bacillus sp. JJ722]|uniref:GNAT family N-acetyltransferase n=1 Tax=Bacillus sp. JJ722 TaxID=3122973 RepID=UPI002FFEB6AE
MALQTDRLRIIPCTSEYVATISDEEYNMGPHITMYLEELKKDSTLLGWGVWLVINKENNSIIGDIGFKGKPNSSKTVEIDYGIIPSAQGNGYATEAVNEIVKWAFSFDTVDVIVAECLIDNLPSIRVLEKLKMKKTEIQHEMIKWQLKK